MIGKSGTSCVASRLPPGGQAARPSQIMARLHARRVQQSFVGRGLDVIRFCGITLILAYHRGPRLPTKQQRATSATDVGVPWPQDGSAICTRPMIGLYWEGCQGEPANVPCHAVIVVCLGAMHQEACLRLLDMRCADGRARSERVAVQQHRSRLSSDDRERTTERHLLECLFGSGSASLNLLSEHAGA